MAYELAVFASIPLTEPFLEHLVDEQEQLRIPRLARLWNYYRNALAEPDSAGGSQGAPAQFVGLPGRFDATVATLNSDRLPREIVIENDIGWRINTLVDFMFPEAPRIVSRSSDPDTRNAVETILHYVLEANGGIALWQNAALLASIYGSVDFLLNTQNLATIRPGAPGSIPPPNPRGNFRPPPSGGGGGAAPSNTTLNDLAARVADGLVIETVEAPRAIAVLNGEDYRQLDAFILHYRQPINAVNDGSMLQRLRQRILGSNAGSSSRASIEVTEVISATHRQRYENQHLVLETPNRLGRVPVVHIQNIAQPYVFDGLSDVEPLIPLQDELNTRISDRANRVTMQSFRMWLGKGIEDFTDRPIGPGQMWVTDNLEASIESFGGDAESPSESAHIEEIREALDKASGVTPAAAGHIKARVGNLTSENAMRISLMGTLAKTKRKRVTFGAGIRELCSLILEALDLYGLFPTSPGDREVDVTWTDPLPPDETRRINDALAKAQLGVPLPVLRAELGYPDRAQD